LPFELVLGQGPEEKVDGHPLTPGSGRLQQLESPAQKSHVPPRRDDVGAVGAHSHPVLDLEDLHAGIALDEFCKDALVVRGQVLHQDKRHARIDVGGHAGKEGREGRQPSGGGSDTDYGKTGIGITGHILHFDGFAGLLRRLDCLGIIRSDWGFCFVFLLCCQGFGLTLSGMRCQCSVFSVLKGVSTCPTPNLTPASLNPIYLPV
jgi:hypothetical protein